jgi:hypothetical protein
VLKDLKDQVAPILTKIYTKSIETGTIPKDWKRANVAPAFKMGERYKAENYRPISLTCICCKLMDFIEGFGKIHNNQVCLYVFVIAGI